MTSKITFKDVGRPEPSVSHIRLLDDNELMPSGGATFAYLLKVHDGELVAEVGVAVCSVNDNFNKKIGFQTARGRLLNYLINKHSEEIEHLAFEHQLGTYSMLAELGATPEVLTTGPNGETYVNIKQDQLSYLQELTPAVMKFIIDYRTSTYEGSNEDVLEEIDSMFSVSDEDDEEDSDDEEDDGDDTDDEESFTKGDGR